MAVPPFIQVMDPVSDTTPDAPPHRSYPAGNVNASTYLPNYMEMLKQGIALNERTGWRDLSSNHPVVSDISSDIHVPNNFEIIKQGIAMFDRTGSGYIYRHAGPVSKIDPIHNSTIRTSN